ncbi:aminotransferase class I/II-fold pyridoxal phosphate-dependent enzyme [[Mycobacterium] kokjensenii]|uniref:cysteine-S-conjugate beta-lyase n=1 Tax=[Mycobacterium] kokjensenii TaxID=3064287 RepID=A0ABM9L9U5_9MYCO|nr:aminotransferase class I/II-fold pyridoxal phosphate-dependent enzyme [Mycolicibacter sp. MU0083]CAJ1495387.1 aminotransferase class I/II-fold pyridoxal phosphate-dependent enzyme [Mycolicibacter sp. MU0083]
MAEVFDALTPDQLRARNTIKWNHFDPDVLPLWIAEMDFPTAAVIRDALRDWVDSEEFGYPALNSEALPTALAAWCAHRYGWAARPEWVRVVPDVLKGMEVVIEFLTRPQSPVALPVPAYMPFFDLLTVTGRQRVEIPMVQQDSGRYLMDLDALDAAFAAGAGSLILCNPNNPLGTAFTAAEIGEIVEIAARHGARVIADEIHAPLVYDRPHVAAASVSDVAADTVVTLMSASKGWNLPGLMCAQVVLSNQRDADDWDRINFLHIMGAATAGIRANIAAYRHGEAWLDALLGQLRANRDHLSRALPAAIPGVRVTRPEATYLAWVDFRNLMLPAEPAEILLADARVALSPGIPFGGGPGFARLNFATTRVILDRAIDAMAGALS